MATYLLVHGGWAGGWAWRRVAALLRSRGNEVVTPTLTGLGERVHLATPAVDLDTHITDIVENTVAVVNEEPVRVTAGKRLPELLRGPFRCRVVGYIVMEDSAGSQIHNDEYV